MAYNEIDNGLDLNFDADPEERKRRLAAIAGMIKGESLGNTAQQMIGERIAPISEAITNPEQALQQRFGVPVQQPQAQGPVGPVMPQEVQQERQGMLPPGQTQQAQQMPVAPVTPEEIQQTQLPQAGPGVQVAGPTQMPAPAAASVDTVKQLTQTNPSIGANAKPGIGTDLNDVYHESVIAARNETDPQKRRQAYAALLGNDSVPEGYKAMAQRFISEDYLKAREQAKAEEKIAQATPNDLARYMQSKSEDGSYLKAILFQRLGLTELAKEEQQKLGAGTKMESAILGDKKYTVERNANGEITRAFNSEGKKAGQEELALLSAEAPMSKNAMYTGGSKIYSIPKGDANEGHEYTSRFNTHLGKFENIITTGPNTGKVYTGAPGLEKRVESAEAINANRLESSKNLINFRLAQNLKYAGPMAYTKAGAAYVGRYNAENGTSLGYNHDGVLVDHNNNNQPVQQNKDGTINATQRIEGKPAAGAAPAATTTPGQVAASDLSKPPAYDPNISPLANKKLQENWAANRRKITTDFITGKQGQTVQSLNVAVDHLDTLADAAKALNNGDVKLFNQISNAYSKNTGEPAVTDFNALKTIVGSEVAKAVAGGATALGDREEIRAEINAASSEKQLLSAINKYQRLMAGQVNGLRQTYVSSGLPAEEFDNKLLPRTKKVLGEASGAEHVPTTPAEKARAEIERRKKGQQ